MVRRAEGVGRPQLTEETMTERNEQSPEPAGVSRRDTLKLAAAIAAFGVAMGVRPADSIAQGKTEGKTEGKTDGKTEGKAGGKAEGKSGGKTEGKSGGKTEGKSGGKTEGKSGGKTEGKTEGKQ
jgi:hypothetical protein